MHLRNLQDRQIGTRKKSISIHYVASLFWKKLRLIDLLLVKKNNEIGYHFLQQEL